ncbi:MAG: glycosyltransferase family 2 protein [Candidatus Omnitrophica bacterium]|nr:glycosyltransferase family 2 protein [Candidatus Omnitrophota bacterium]
MLSDKISSNPICDIIIPIWNQKERTERCLQSILKNTQIPYRLILVDNASEKETAEFLNGFERSTTVPCLVIRNQENLGNVKAVNQGIKSSAAEFVLTLDNDTLVFSGWLENMIQAAKSQDQIGIVNPGSNSLGYKKPWYLSWEKYAAKVLIKEKGRRPEIGMASGFCMLVKRELINKIGGWNEAYGMGYYEDSDYSRRAYNAGYVCVHARDAFVYHEEHASFKKIKKVKENIAAPNRAQFEEKFGKPKRIVYCLFNPDRKVRERVASEAFQLGRGNDWITIFINRGAEFPEYKDHGFIRYVRMLDWIYLPQTLIRVIKKKKKFARIVTNNRFLLFWFRRLKGIHKSELIFLD